MFQRCLLLLHMSSGVPALPVITPHVLRCSSAACYYSTCPPVFQRCLLLLHMSSGVPALPVRCESWAGWGRCSAGGCGARGVRRRVRICCEVVSGTPDCDVREEEAMCVTPACPTPAPTPETDTVPIAVHRVLLLDYVTTASTTARLTTQVTEATTAEEMTSTTASKTTSTPTMTTTKLPTTTSIRVQMRARRVIQMKPNARKRPSTY